MGGGARKEVVHVSRNVNDLFSRAPASNDEAISVQLECGGPGVILCRVRCDGRLDVRPVGGEADCPFPVPVVGEDAHVAFAKVRARNLYRVLARRFELALPLLEPERGNGLHWRTSPRSPTGE